MKKAFLSAFYINLIQDINILRPLIYLMHDDFGLKSKIIVSHGFIIKNEDDESWLNEIKQIADYHSPFNGGRHCVRDVIEQTLRVQEKWLTDGSFKW